MTNDCKTCPVSTGTHKPAEALHKIAEPDAQHLQELAAYRFTVENLQARVAELEDQLKAAPQAVPGVGALYALQEAEAALELAIHRILKRDPGHAVHVTSEAKALVAVRAALDTAAHHTHQGLDDRDVFERAYAEHAIAYAGLDAHVDDVVQRVKDGRDGNSYKHLHDSGAWVGWNLALAAQAKQGEQA